jgi:hypothetical protein
LPTAGRSRPVSAPTAGCRRPVPAVLAKGGPTERPGPAPRFGIGDRVRTRNHQPKGHTRLPGYARGREGIVTALHGCHVYPDTNAHFEGEQPCPLYTVRFDATELFGGMPIRP